VSRDRPSCWVQSGTTPICQGGGGVQSFVFGKRWTSGIILLNHTLAGTARSADWQKHDPPWMWHNFLLPLGVCLQSGTSTSNDYLGGEAVDSLFTHPAIFSSREHPILRLQSCLPGISIWLDFLDVFVTNNHQKQHFQPHVPPLH
jgi:hypothetical protein